MKLSKKIVAIILTMAMVIAQVSVLPFAENTYASGKGDSASYAMRVPSDEKVAHGTGATSWLRTTASVGRNENNTDYATGYIFTEEINSEKFFVMTPKQGAAASNTYLMFKSNAYNTYSSEGTRLYNGIPDCIPSGIEGMAFRIKGGATAADKMYLNIALCVKGTGNSGYNYVVTNDLVFYDAVTGAKSAITYDSANGGILLAGNADGYIYAPLTGIVNGSTAITEAGLREQSTSSGNYNGYRGIQYKFGTTDFGGETLYIGDAYFVGNDEDFDLVHAAPAAPTLKEATASSIEVNTESGMLYAIEKGGVIGEYTASGLFEGLESGTTYKVYAKKDNANALYAAYAELSTKGVLAPVASEVTHKSIKVDVAEGQEYSIDGATWNTTGVFTGLDSATEYTITTRSIEDHTLTRTLVVSTKSEPYSYVKGDGAYYALQIADGTVKLDSTKVTASDKLGRNDDNTGYAANGNLFMTNIDSVQYIVLAPEASEGGTASIKATSLTYGTVSGIPDAIEKFNSIEAIAVRLKVAGAVSADAKFKFALGNYALADGNYTFINAADGKQSIIASESGFSAVGELDGFVIIPLTSLVTAEGDVATAAKLKTGYITFDIAMSGNWTDRALYVNSVLFLTNTVNFLRIHSVPLEPAVTDRGKNHVTIETQEGVIYSIDNGATWTDDSFDGKFTGLTVETIYAVYAKYAGATNHLEFNIATRDANVTLVAPTIKNTTKNSVEVNVVPDHEYSIDEGATWNRTGIFTGLNHSTVYYVISRVIEETATSDPVMAETAGGIYSTGWGDGTNYMFRVPNTDKNGNALPTLVDLKGDTVEYITKSLGVNTWIGGGIGRDPADITVSKNSDQGGAYLIKTFDGERFIQLNPVTSGEANTNITTRMPYNGAPYYGSTTAIGIPDEIGIQNVDGFAFRVKIENVVTPVGFTFYIPMKKVGSSSTTSFGHYDPKPDQGLEYKFIDAKTGEISTLEYQKVIKFTEESYDGWVVIPKELYSEDARSLLETQYSGIQPWAHGGNCTNHGGAWSLWHPDTTFYLGDSVFLSDVDKFILANSAPEKPVKVNKTSTTINVKPESGVEYALSKDATEWNETGSFTGLTPNTLYTIYARYRGRVHTSALALYTDMENPPLIAPQNAVATQTTIKVDVIPGLEYSIDGNIWNEEGEWAGLEAETTYTVRARIKGTTEEATTIVTTLEYVNIYVTDMDPNLSWLTKIPDPAVSPTVGRDWGWAGAAMHPDLVDGKSIPVRDFNGEFFIEYTTYKRSDTQLGLRHSQTFPGHTTLPVELNLHKQEALVLRVKVTGVTGSSTPAKFSFYTSTSAGYSIIMDKNSTVFFVQKDTGWTRAATGSDRQTFTEDFDGYIVVPLTSLLSSKVDMNWLKNTWSNVTPWLHDTSCTHGMSESCWDGKFYYQGNNYFAYDMDLFLKQYSAPDAPTLKQKSTTYITVNDIDGALYSIDNGATWQESPTFTGLTENTAYSIIAKYKINEKGLVSQAFNTQTDMANPPLDTPELISLDDEYAVIKVIPGLEYSHDEGKTWNETGIFGILDPNTEYTIIGRNKITKESTAPLEIKTPFAPNPYLNEDGITSKWFTMTRYGDKYKEYWFGAMVFVKDEANSTEEETVWKPAYNYNAGGELDVVTDENGERFVNFHIQEGKKPDAHKTNFNLSGQKTYQKSDNGFPRAIWVRDCWGMAVRMKIEDVGNENLGFTLYINSEKNGQASFKQGSTYYLVDKETKTWEKKSLNGNFKLTGFDGWLMIPFNSMNLTMEQIQYGFKTLQIFHNGDAENSWIGVDFMVGESVVVHDAQAFVDLYAPNTTDKIAGEAHNVMEDETIPAIMANDCSGNEIGNGIHSFDNTRATVRQITKAGGQASKALAVNAAGGTFSAIRFANDSLNYKEVPQEKEFQVMDSLGMAFYLEVPEEASEKVGFDVEILEEGTEYYTYSKERFYYTIEDGQIRRYFDKLEFKPGFKGYVILPYENFDINLDSSEIVDGMLFSPHRIEYFSFIFDADTYPALGEIALIVDDFMQWQDLEEFGTALIKKQGGSEFKVMDVVLTLHNDDSGLPRMMANDGTGIEVEKGIFSLSNVELSLVDIKGTIDSYVKVKIGNGNSNVMLGNYGIYDGQSTDEYEKILNSEGITFTVNVPKDAPMIVGMDLELRENYDDYLEYYLYDADTFYYTVENGEVYKVFGYLEFEPGFNGTVIIPFENFWFDEEYSDYYDGELNDKDCIEYFGFYFSTNYYAAIGGTEIGIDSVAYYDGAAFDYIDAVWSQQTGKTGKK